MSTLEHDRNEKTVNGQGKQKEARSPLISEGKRKNPAAAQNLSIARYNDEFPFPDHWPFFLGGNKRRTASSAQEENRSLTKFCPQEFSFDNVSIDLHGNRVGLFLSAVF